MNTLEFPLWLRLTHYANFFMLTLLVRSGIQILADHPKLYWRDHCTPGSEWIGFGRKQVSSDTLWTSMDEAVTSPVWLGLPGGYHTLGLARHWHFLAALFWVVNGIFYVGLLMTTGQWPRLIPTSWDVFPQAWNTFLEYLTFHLPSSTSLAFYDPLQQLAYAGVVFLLAPLTILTGAAMSPALAANFPWYPRLFGGRQAARSIHFLLMIAYLLFLVVHVSLVAITGFAGNMDRIVLGKSSGQETTAIAIALGAILVIVLFNIAVTVWSHRQPRRVQLLTGIWMNALDRLLSRFTSRQSYSKQAISPYFRVNGLPPTTLEWHRHARENFADWRLVISGLVETPLQLTLEELQRMPQMAQITEHICIQGWSAIAEWTGVSLSEIMQRCRPLPQARYLIFHSYQQDEEGQAYYSSLTLEEVNTPQTILAYAMNGKPLPIEHGAPIRLRVETKLGFKMTKWIRSIELIADYRSIGLGQGGYKEDREYYSIGAEI